MFLVSGAAKKERWTKLSLPNVCMLITRGAELQKTSGCNLSNYVTADH